MIPHPLVATTAAAVGVILAGWVGIYVLYVPMVSTAYSRLYEAYCTSDAVGQILTKQAGSANFARLKSSNGCSEPSDDSSKPSAVASDPSKPTAVANAALKPLSVENDSSNPSTVANDPSKHSAVTSDSPKPTLGQGDVFFLLNALGLLESREKTAKDLFSNEPLTNNHDLALALVDRSIYFPAVSPPAHCSLHWPPAWVPVATQTPGVSRGSPTQARPLAAQRG